MNKKLELKVKLVIIITILSFRRWYQLGNNLCIANFNQIKKYFAKLFSSKRCLNWNYRWLSRYQIFLIINISFKDALNLNIYLSLFYLFYFFFIIFFFSIFLLPFFVDKFTAFHTRQIYFAHFVIVLIIIIVLL